MTIPDAAEADPSRWASARAFRRHFWQPPRAHGDVIAGRAVSFLELFYDLVYVVVVAQAAHHLIRANPSAHHSAMTTTREPLPVGSPGPTALPPSVIA